MIDSRDVFYVRVKNRGSETLRIWRPTTSWGWWSLSFVMTAPNGQSLELYQSPDQGFTMNGPWYDEVLPDSVHYLSVRLADPPGWEGRGWLCSDPSFSEGLVSLRARYVVAPTPESETKNVWTGHVASNPYRVYLRR